MELTHTPTSNQPYEVAVDIDEVLRRAQVGMRFEQCLAMDDALFHTWPSNRLALAGCKLQVAVKLGLDRDAERLELPKTPQHRWPNELAEKLLTSVDLTIPESVAIVQGQGSDFPCQAIQYYPSVACPDVAFSVVWTLPISAPIPLYTALQAKATVTPFDQWQVEKVTLIPQYQVIEPVEKAITNLERRTVHRQSGNTPLITVPLTQPLKKIQFNSKTPYKRAVIRHKGTPVLSLSDRVIPDGNIDLQGLDCTDCELEIMLDSNDHLKYGDRIVALAALGLVPTMEKEFAVYLVYEQALLTSAYENRWQ